MANIITEYSKFFTAINILVEKLEKRPYLSEYENTNEIYQTKIPAPRGNWTILKSVNLF